ncbi:MAG: 7TM-DISM domain-containing protein, partial [Myxococcota bacterium]|nr:7TM-DISM domain-containing protein [Myxococcota bacterium]
MVLFLGTSASSHPVLSGGLESQAVGGLVRFWEERDPNQNNSDGGQDEVLLEEIVAFGSQLPWLDAGGKVPSLGFRDSAYWFHLEMTYAGESDGEGILELAYA